MGWVSYALLSAAFAAATAVLAKIGVAGVDKLSLALTAVLAIAFLHEPFSWRVAGGVALMVAGALVMIE